MPLVETSKLPVKEPRPGWRGRFFHSDHMTFAYYDIAPGSDVHTHHHSQEEVWHVIEGELELVVDGVTSVVRAGDAAVVPADVAHSGAGRRPLPCNRGRLSDPRVDRRSQHTLSPYHVTGIPAATRRPYRGRRAASAASSALICPEVGSRRRGARRRHRVPPAAAGRNRAGRRGGARVDVRAGAAVRPHRRPGCERPGGLAACPGLTCCPIVAPDLR